MKQLLLALELLFACTEGQAQQLLDIRLSDFHLGYGVSNLAPNGLHFGSSIFWEKPLGWTVGFRITPSLTDLKNGTQSVDNPYTRVFGLYTGVDYQLLDDYSNHKLTLSAAPGVAVYSKALTGQNLIFEPEQTTVVSANLRLGGRYQYQFGLFGIYVQPWMLVGKKREIGIDGGIVIRRER